MRREPADRLVGPNRLAWIAAGAVGIAWVGLEDQGPRGPLLVAAVLMAALGLTLLRRWSLRAKGKRPTPDRLDSASLHAPDSRLVWLAQAAASGATAGALVGPVAALLMMVKTSLHAHPAPEFLPSDLAQALLRTPAWLLGGLSVGAALGLLLLAVDGEPLRRPPS